MDSTRRGVLRALLGVGAGVALGGTLGRLAHASEPVTHDVAIVGGRVIDPRSGLDGLLNLAIDGERVSWIGSHVPTARETIDASGLVVAPGFVDILADNAHDTAETCAIFEKYKLTDGVTTPLLLHGGTHDPRGYYAAMGRRPHRTNYGASTKIMRIRRRKKSVAGVIAAARRCLDEGALALSHSIEYQPTPYRELLRLARLAAERDVPLFLHLRYSSKERELKGVDEALRLAADSGCRLHIDHLHSTGGSWHMDAALDRIDAARQRGAQVTACVYPYSYWATYPSSRRFEPGWRRRYGLTWSDLRIVGTGERLDRATFRKMRRKPWALVAVPEGTMPLEETVLPALRRSWVMVGSDGGIESEPRANNHPRGAGCFATALALARDHDLPLTEMVRKMTDLPASLLRPRVAAMERRGSLRPGDIADIVVFDPATVAGRATVENPCQPSAGIHWVFVSGKAALAEGKLTDARAGRPVRAM